MALGEAIQMSSGIHMHAMPKLSQLMLSFLRYPSASKLLIRTSASSIATLLLVNSFKIAMLQLWWFLCFLHGGLSWLYSGATLHDILSATGSLLCSLSDTVTTVP
ncbi:expressed unknown protein [Seminavis robusta]|uniref:Uncharacterized protein n=1 Tax=Seminavis robusta TaxID=568900 RepID=A0A9N8HS14_9STRA|nr:expressed unknown protein [Seminavis robusta]CAB9523856.1 expressed unknown protein [Seminavis robusta]|eukprot:Sro1464_g274881.1  (105) ;mRNA; r:6959-7273